MKMNSKLTLALKLSNGDSRVECKMLQLRVSQFSSNIKDFIRHARYHDTLIADEGAGGGGRALQPTLL